MVPGRSLHNLIQLDQLLPPVADGLRTDVDGGGDLGRVGTEGQHETKQDKITGREAAGTERGAFGGAGGGYCNRGR